MKPIQTVITLIAIAAIAIGEAERRIASGKYKPTSWSPADSLWGRLLNFDAD